MQVLNAEALIATGRCIKTPFKMVVRQANRELELEFIKILRILPSKRIVGVAVTEGREFLVKVYLGRSSARYARRERNGVGLIAEAGVRSPRLMWNADIVGGGGEALGFEYLEDAVSLFDRWRESCGEDTKVEILTRAMVIIGKLHNQGVVQNDIHLANFLLAGGKLYTIDGGDIVKRSRPPLSEAPSLRNLGMFFAQFYPRYDELVQIVLPAYEAVRGWNMDSSRLQLIGREIVRNRERRKKTCLAKAFRDCTRFVCKSTFDRFEVCERSAYTPEMEALMSDPDKLIASGKILKNANSSTVSLVQIDGRPLVIKRYNFKNSWHRIRRLFRRSRAWTSWANACRMEFLGIPSVKPVALIERRTGPIRGVAYFVTEYIEGQDALKCLRSLKKFNGEPEALSSILRDLSDSRISHGDLKATNFVMSAQGPVILDLDVMREHRNQQLFERAFRRDLARFMQNWQGRPELVNHFEGLLDNLNH